MMQVCTCGLKPTSLNRTQHSHGGTSWLNRIVAHSRVEVASVGVGARTLPAASFEVLENYLLFELIGDACKQLVGCAPDKHVVAGLRVDTFTPPQQTNEGRNKSIKG
jgi:hypothetical protein